MISGVAALGWAQSARAQSSQGPDTTESTTENSTGTVTAVSHTGTITVASRRGPFTYRLGLDLHIIGPDTKPLKLAQVRAGDTATVYYYIRDGQLTVGRIVVLERAPAGGRDK
jgi:hypothetical protein